MQAPAGAAYGVTQFAAGGPNGSRIERGYRMRDGAWVSRRLIEGLRRLVGGGQERDWAEPSLRS